ncbi:MAG: hypothetical protein ACFFB5_02395 [Promethearchaeota archaeon]
MSFFTRQLERFRTEIIAGAIALVMIATGLILPFFIPDQLPSSPQGFEDAAWIKTLISLLFIGMGIVCFVWLVIIQRFILRRSKKDYMY